MPLNNEPIEIAVTAQYIKQRIPRYRDNPLIEALPPALDDEALGDYLREYPEFDAEQRTWPAYERLHMIAELASFMVPMERHIRLAWALDTMLRQGYVGRAPRTAEHVRVFQQLYEAQQAGKAFNRVNDLAHVTSQISSALIGVSGGGKTTTIKRVFLRYPQVIYHPELDFHQITYLHIEAPHDGISTKGLANSILRKVDQLITDGHYYQQYAKSTSSAETLLNHVARVMNAHLVGLLVVDEIHNLKNAGTSMRKMMSVLVSASNELGVPILFVGTNRAVKVLGLDFSPARRSVGSGFPEWGCLSASHDLQKPMEWEDFISTLWPLQWVKHPTPLTQSLANLLFYYSQGIVDIAIKIFACAQWQAILDASETITAQTLDSVWKCNFVLIHPMMDAYRSGDTSALDLYSDIAPIKFSNLLDDALNKYEGLRSSTGAVRPGHDDFAPTIASALVSMGVDKERALGVAASVEQHGKVTGVLDGTQAAIDLITPPKRQSVARKSKSATVSPAELSPDDYRNAIRASVDQGGTVFSRLEAMGAVCDVDTLLELG